MERSNNTSFTIFSFNFYSVENDASYPSFNQIILIISDSSNFHLLHSDTCEETCRKKVQILIFQRFF